MRPTAYEFRCGAIEHIGCVSIVWEHCAYIVRRHPDYGHKVDGSPRLKEARKIAAAVRREAQAVRR